MPVTGQKNWDSFGVHFPNEKATDNPFFPETATDDAEVSYLLDMLTEGKATMQMQYFAVCLETRRGIDWYEVDAI